MPAMLEGFVEINSDLSRRDAGDDLEFPAEHFLLGSLAGHDVLNFVDEAFFQKCAFQL